MIVLDNLKDEQFAIKQLLMTVTNKAVKKHHRVLAGEAVSKIILDIVKPSITDASSIVYWLSKNEAHNNTFNIYDYNKTVIGYGWFEKEGSIHIELLPTTSRPRLN